MLPLCSSKKVNCAETNCVNGSKTNVFAHKKMMTTAAAAVTTTTDEDDDTKDEDMVPFAMKIAANEIAGAVAGPFCETATTLF